MRDTIYRDDAIKAIKDHSFALGDDYMEINGYGAIDDIRALPSVDRPQGEWKPFDLTWGRSIYACSVCEESIAVPCGWSDGKPIYNYCPMCGAKMKGADNE